MMAESDDDSADSFHRFDEHLNLQVIDNEINFKVIDSVCSSCNNSVNDSELLTCSKCSRHTHALCKNASKEICTKSFLAAYRTASVKNTFGCFNWICKGCITRSEWDNTQFDKTRLLMLEKQLASVNSKLSDLASVNPKLNHLEKLVMQKCR